jgi:hypothetical protein
MAHMNTLPNTVFHLHWNTEYIIIQICLDFLNYKYRQKRERAISETAISPCCTLLLAYEFISAGTKSFSDKYMPAFRSERRHSGLEHNFHNIRGVKSMTGHITMHYTLKA